MLKQLIIAEYQRGNKWVRAGFWFLGIGVAFFVLLIIGMVYLWLTDFPMRGVPIPHWMSFSMFGGLIYTLIGCLFIVFGMEPPNGGGGGKRKRMKSKSSVRIVVQPT